MMKIAIIGSRNVNLNTIHNFISHETETSITEIITGGAVGIDTLAMQYANENNIKLTVFKPEYEKYSRSAPLKRNHLIVEASDIVIAIWDGKSRGTKYTIDYAKKLHKKTIVYII